MALTVEQIRATESDEALFELLSSELERLIPKAYHDERDLYHRKVATLPRGLRAMAGIQFFNVSMAMDDLAWHFGNQNDERDLRETLDGLRELGLVEIAEQFEWAWEFMKPYMPKLKNGIGCGEFSDGRSFSEWLSDVGARDFVAPMNEMIWKYCEQHPKHRLLASCIENARKHPERFAVAQAYS
jgi:hypothetical protein